jgi:hypothetical protein
MWLSSSSNNLLIQPEELLIDFRELIGEHSGENMAEVVWETLKRYGLENRVCFLLYFIVKC